MLRLRLKIIALATGILVLLWMQLCLADGPPVGPHPVSPKPDLFDKKTGRSITTGDKLPVKPEGVDQPQRMYGSASGTGKALVILLEFPDQPAKANHPASLFWDMLFSQNTYPSGSMYDYYQEVSYGTLALAGDVTRWYTAPQPYSFYVNGNQGFGPYPANAQKMVEHAISLADPDVDFSQYDTNGDGYVDALFIIHTGPGAEETGSAHDIWSHAWAIPSPLPADGVSVWSYSMEPEEHENGNVISIGVFCHEFGHILGLPDLYDTDLSSDGIGLYGLMGFGSWGGDGRSPHRPVHMCAWSKMKLGWISATEVDDDFFDQGMHSIGQTPEALRLWANGNAGHEYFIVSNRQKEGFDTLLPGSGLLIWHIDESVPHNNDELHKLVDLEEADGLNHLNVYANFNRGDAGDYFPGTTGNRTWDEHSKPNSLNYQGIATSVAVRDVRNSAGVMRADVLVSGRVYPDIRSSVTSVHFGTVSVNATAHEIFSLHNDGEALLMVMHIVSDSDAFVVASPSFPQTVIPGGILEVAIAFTPAAAGSVSGQLRIESDDPNENPLVVSVTGVGADTESNIELSGTSHDFGNVPVNETSAWQFTIFNTGSGSLRVYSIVSNHSDFDIAAPDFPQEVPVGGSIEVTVRFRPQSEGLKSGQLTLSSNDPDRSLISMTVDGFGSVPPSAAEVELAVRDHDFGPVPLGETGGWSFSMRNSGGIDLQISSVRSESEDFQILSPNFPCTISPGASISVAVAFVPSTAGIRSGLLTISCSDEDEETICVNLTGTGLAPQISVSASSIERVLSEAEELTVQLSLTNLGNAPLSFEIGEMVSWLIVAPLSGTVGANQNADVMITLSSASLAEGEYSSTITVSSDDPENGSVTIPVTMRVETAPIYVGTPLTYGFPRDTVVIDLEMDNETEKPVPVSGVQVELHFHSAIFSPVQILPSERSQSMNSMIWSMPEPGRIILLISDTNGHVIPSGRGAIAHFRFTIDEAAEAGQTYWIEYQKVILSDEEGRSLPIERLNGLIVIGCKGDMNCDGCIDVVDLVRVVNIILGSITPAEAELWAADFNSDGVIDVMDVVSMVNNICGASPVAANGDKAFAKIGVRGARGEFGENARILFEVDHASGIAGVQCELDYDTGLFTLHAVELSERCGSMDLRWNDRDGRLTVLVYSRNGGFLPAGDGPVFFLKGAMKGDCGSAFHVEEVLAVNAEGRSLAVEGTGEPVRFESGGQPVFSLIENYPNPFNSTTSIQYSVLSDRFPPHVTLKLFNILGQEVRTLVDRVQDPGHYSVTWDGRDHCGKDVVSGTYFCRLTAGDFTATKTMTLLK
ncbi:MAG: M6 family metalloprotease domain-containing protein [Gemmatimonadota bacterium]|nr:MAG: M6 family metalloprotease domain-containing protein [Gemmatimonadota bacterium]